MSKKNDYIQIANTLSLLSQLGLMMVIPIFGLAFLGRYIDTKLDSEPIFFLIFLVVGIGAGFMGVYNTLRGYLKRK